MKKRYRYRKELLPYLEKLFRRDQVLYAVSGEYVLTDVSARRFHCYVEEAMCERQRKGKRTPVLSYNMISSRNKRAQKIGNRKNFILLEKDAAKFLKSR
jgi:hypothetical protein